MFYSIFSTGFTIYMVVGLAITLITLLTIVVAIIRQRYVNKRQRQKLKQRLNNVLRGGGK